MKVYTGSVWVDAYAAGTSFLAKANNLSDLPSASTARTNLGLGTAATTAATAYATAAQGTTADTALQPATIGSTVQGYDADLQAIGAITATSGLLKKTAANTWSLDTNTYLTSAVTSVTGTSPVVSSGGTTPAISIPAATTSVNGYLTSTDWTTFNNKGSGSVTSVAATVPSVFSIAGSPITTSGTLAITYSGTALPVLNGGTGVTTSTGTTNVVLSGSPTIVTPVIAQINDANGNAELKFSAIASAVNQVTIENSATGNPVHISATGTDTNIGIHLAPKGTSGYVNVQGGLDDTKRLMFNPNGATTNTRTMISSVQTVDRTITLPDATDTLVGKATTDTLTNKSISGSTNTLSDIGNASLTNSAITINGTSTSLGGSISVGTVTSVTGTSPVVSSGGATPAISMPAATTSVNGYLTSTDWTTFNNKSNTNGTVTSVAALTLGTTGTDFSSTVATGTTTPVITLNVPTASASNRGALSSTDWTTFNNKTSNTGTVTSVSGTGTVNGLTLTGTVTTTGSLTLGGTLDLSSPPAIGGTTAATITGTTITGTKFVGISGGTF
jgi:hypothetical protein